MTTPYYNNISISYIYICHRHYCQKKAPQLMDMTLDAVHALRYQSHQAQNGEAEDHRPQLLV